MNKLILASASPRRLALLNQIGINPDEVLPADIDESVQPKETVINYVKRMALSKAKTVFENHKGCFILAADTVVARGNTILPKALDDETVLKCMNLLSGRRHNVYGGICLITPSGKTIIRTCKTCVIFKRLDTLEIKDYISSKDGIGKAGGYAIQGKAGVFVNKLIGSYPNVVGLDIFTTNNLLKGNGFFK
ncbi:MAG: Maf family nucleotide pyrophosphatase [Alphaproteobacteria bacterium]|nr:Maf family nucleotide pyrophosphatase [Alphaproteobacteria bacterium]